MLYKALGEAKILGQITASKMTIMLHEEFNFPRAGGRTKGPSLYYVSTFLIFF
jgi:hypothetical protein